MVWTAAFIETDKEAFIDNNIKGGIGIQLYFQVINHILRSPISESKTLSSTPATTTPFTEAV